MTVMTQKQKELLDQLIAVAGSSELVLEALKSLNEDSHDSNDIRNVIRRILELRHKREELASAPSD